MEKTLLAALMTIVSAPLSAETGRYVLDPSHSQVLFQYEHFGYSTTWGLFSGFSGEIDFRPEDPATSSVAVSIPVMSMLTGWQDRFETFMGEDFFDATEADVISFRSTGITVTGENRADIAGELSMNGITHPVVLDTRLNQMGPHPIDNRAWVGFDATATILRSDFDLGQFAPFVSDEVKVQISIEAGKAD